MYVVTSGLNTYTAHDTKLLMSYFDQKPISSAPEKVLLALALYFFIKDILDIVQLIFLIVFVIFQYFSKKLRKI